MQFSCFRISIPWHSIGRFCISFLFYIYFTSNHNTYFGSFWNNLIHFWQQPEKKVFGPCYKVQCTTAKIWRCTTPSTIHISILYKDVFFHESFSFLNCPFPDSRCRSFKFINMRTSVRTYVRASVCSYSRKLVIGSLWDLAWFG